LSSFVYFFIVLPLRIESLDVAILPGIKIFSITSVRLFSNFTTQWWQYTATLACPTYNTPTFFGALHDVEHLL
jgi:hypothetical protein